MSRVIVAGSINMDIVALTKKQPKVGETVFGTNLKYFPGGKGANQAISASKLGSKATIVGMVGSDNFGKELVRFLEKQGLKSQIKVTPKSSTGVALITVLEKTSDNTIVVMPGANFELTEKYVEKTKMTKNDILVCQFEIPIKTIGVFFKKGKKIGTINILNPAPAKSISKDLLKLVDILILNKTELEIISKRKVFISDKNSISDAVDKIRNNKQAVIVTLGEKGVVGFINNTIIKIKGRKVKAVDTTGAGDCFIGAIAAQLSNHSSLIDAIKFANIAASICVTRQGAGLSMPTLQEVNSVYKTA